MQANGVDDINTLIGCVKVNDYGFVQETKILF